MSCASDLFELKCIFKNINVVLCDYIECGVKQLLALITSDDDIILYYTYGEISPVVKRIPWFTDCNKAITAICFDPTASWLLIVSVDGSLYILPALSLVDKKQKVDCKWSLNDLTYFNKQFVTPNVRPTSVVWWQTLDCNQNALVGYENGIIALISLTDGRCLGSCCINEPVSGLALCRNNNSEPVSLLINGQNGQQWRLLLETQAVGYLWPPESNNQSEESTKSRLLTLKQMGVDKFVSLKQKISDARNSYSDTQSQSSDTSSDSSHLDQKSVGPEPLPHLCDTYFAPQYARKRYLFSAFYKPSSLLTIHTFSLESAPLYVYKLVPNTKTVLLADLFIYAVNQDGNEVSIISSHLSESRLEGESEFNVESLVNTFRIEDEQIMKIYKRKDLLSSKPKNYKEQGKNKSMELPKTMEELRVSKPRVDTCIIITDKAVYRIELRTSPVYKFIEYVTIENKLEEAEQLSIIFSLNIQQLLECCGDLLIARGSFHSGIILYKQAKVHLLKRVLKLAVAADCRTLLKFVHLCLSASRVDMSVTTKIHIGNLAVMAYTELILRYNGAVRVSNTKDFMKFLCHEEYYDQILAVNVACQVGQWNIVSLLARARGLQPEVVSAFGQILQSARAPRITDHNFLLALSEPSLTQSLLISPQNCQNILHYVRTNIDAFPLEILQRLVIQLDPSQPCALPLVSRLFRSNNRYSSSFDTGLESIDIENPDRALVTVKDFIETFLLVLIKLISKMDVTIFSLDVLKECSRPQSPVEEKCIKNLPELHPLSAGYKHAAIVRNGNIYTMGLSSCGCLGTGPLLTHSSPPKILHTLTNLRVEALSVSCGRKHTIALTDYGVYSWGSNSHGQLGLGSNIQESSYPQLISSLAFQKIIDITAGQYHSLALTVSGSVYTWGWGIHGQLGHGTCDDEYLPRLLDFEHPVMQVAAGHAHTLLLTCDGRLFGFGSNVFGQLECCNIDSGKTSRPVWVVLMPDMYVPIKKIATSYFHNIAVREDEQVYIWGASPQEVRIAQSKNSQKHNGMSVKPQESLRFGVRIYSADVKKPVERISVGYKHTAIIHSGKILWGKNKDEELSSPKLREQDSLYVFNQKFVHVSCGLDYTMAIDYTGKLLAWGSPSMAQAILGKPIEDSNSSLGSKILVLKNTRRVVKIPGTLDLDHYPIEVPGIPTMAITFNSPQENLLLSKKLTPYSVLSTENPISKKGNESNKNNFSFLKPGAKVKVGQKTLHFALQLYHGIYDTENVLLKCLDINNYQAASKIAMLNGHYGDSLGFQLSALKKYMDSLDFDSLSAFMNKDDYDLKEKNQDQIEADCKSRFEVNEKNLIHSSSGEVLYTNSCAYVLSSSSSLDSIRQWGDEIEHQGGRESPCEATDLVDIKQNVTHYVQSLKNSNESINSVSKMLDESNSATSRAKNSDEKDLDTKDKQAKEILEIASNLVEFYTNKIYTSENHILMQNILLKCIEFWLSNNLPVSVLERILLKNMDKYFYPLSILLFCKNFDDNYEEDMLKSNDFLMKPHSASFLKEFSNKFCLQLCSMVLENVNKA